MECARFNSHDLFRMFKASDYCWAINTLGIVLEWRYNIIIQQCPLPESLHVVTVDAVVGPVSYPDGLLFLHKCYQEN